MKPVSLQLYSLREQAKGDFVGVLKAVAEMGYVGVEPAGLHGMEATLSRSMARRSTLQPMRAAARAASHPAWPAPTTMMS